MQVFYSLSTIFSSFSFVWPPFPFWSPFDSQLCVAVFVHDNENKTFAITHDLLCKILQMYVHIVLSTKRANLSHTIILGAELSLKYYTDNMFSLSSKSLFTTRSTTTQQERKVKKEKLRTTTTIKS